MKVLLGSELENYDYAEIFELLSSNTPVLERGTVQYIYRYYNWKAKIAEGY